MFEREITDSMFVQRWSIVRTLMPQSIAEHTFAVTHYANDIAVYLGLPVSVHLSLLQYAIWHDAQDEIFTGDLPGPNKRGLLDAIGPEAKERWDIKLREWASAVFGNLSKRNGGKLAPDNAVIVKLVLKTADWLEASVRMANEAQMGNACAERHIVPNMNGALETLTKLIEAHYGVKIDPGGIPFNGGEPERAHLKLSQAIEHCVDRARNGQSRGPMITGEDATRGYHGPCVDSAA